MKVTVKADHTHAGVKYAKGSTIDAPLHDALWLKQRDLIKEPLGAIGAEIKKLEARDQGAYADALDAAAAAEAARKREADGAAK